MFIRRYKVGEERVLWELFYNTIRNINIIDYSEKQVKAWASDEYSSSIWIERFRKINPFVVVIDGKILGYSSLDNTGYIDHFYCHHLYQGCGVGRAMIENIFIQAKNLKIKTLTTEASITAKPFFLHFGFKVEKEQLVLVRGQYLKNFVMKLNLVIENR